ncbi:MAG: DVUA0089 family protein [Spirochaetaceae bacterium]|jgi:hypothetical protein|nr:DVUA0089 family protein [Spirochaetaceae bacterium]
MMSKRISLLLVFFFTFFVLYGQNSANTVGQPELDNAVKSLAAEIQKKIPAGGTVKILLGQWTYYDSVPALGSYWAAQLTGELANVPNRSFILVSGGGADWTVSGEIIETPGAIRVYTRLIRSAGQSIEASFQADFEMNSYLAEMLSSGGSSSSVFRDAYEFDSMENPQTVEIGTGEGGPATNRTIHTENDEDFFLLVADREGTLTIETTGSMDTYMELYNADSGEKLDNNDDGGSGSNARIRRQVVPGSRYIAKVRGYDSGTGTYGLRAWISETIRIPPDEYENDDDFDSAKDLSPGTPQRHTFTTGDDVDWVQFRISQAGRYTIRTRGVNSSGLDTYIELYDEDRDSIDDDDDGGEDYDSRLSLRLQAGTYYLRVECLNDEPDQPYTISVEEDR